MTLAPAIPKTQRIRPESAAQDHLLCAHNIWTAHGQADTALGHLTAGLLALAKQVARIEKALAERVT